MRSPAAALPAALPAALLPAAPRAAEGFTWLGGAAHALGVGEHVATLALVGLVLAAAGLAYRASISKASDLIIPDEGVTFRNACECYGAFIRNQCKQIMGEEAASRHFAFIATVFIVILSCNLVGLVPGFLPPTEHLSTTLALGCASFAYYNLQGCREQGVVAYVRHFAGPLWYLAFLIFPIEVISNLVRPLSLALRLKNNMMGDHLVLAEFSNLVPFAVPVVFMVLGILVSVIQAYVFTVLTMVYVSLATHHDHGGDGRHA